MTSDLVAKARRLIAWHKSELERLTEWMETAQRLQGSLRSLTVPPESAAAEDTTGMEVLSKPDLLRWCRDVLLAHGEPMNRREILAELTRRKMTLIGKNKERVLGTYLWRSPDFINLKDRGYWLADRGVPGDM